MKATSQSSETYDVPKAELLRRLGLTVTELGAGEQVQVVLSLDSSNAHLTIQVTRHYPEHDVPEVSAVREPVLDQEKPGLIRRAREAVLPPLHPSLGEQMAEPLTEVEPPRPGHLLGCKSWCQQKHPSLGGYQPGPPSGRPVQRGERGWDQTRAGQSKPVPRDHTLEQEGPGDPI